MLEPHEAKMLSEIHGGLNQLIPQVADTKAAVQKLDDDVNEMKVVNARQTDKIKANTKHIDNVGAKIRGHIDQQSIHQEIPPAPKPEEPFAGATIRWRFVGAVVVAVSGLIGLAVVIASVIPK